MNGQVFVLVRRQADGLEALFRRAEGVDGAGDRRSGVGGLSVELARMGSLEGVLDEDVGGDLIVFLQEREKT